MSSLPSGLVASLIPDAEDIEELSAGTWSQAFAFTSKNQRLVIRFGGESVEYEKDRLAHTWSCAALPVPEILDVGYAFDTRFAVSRRIEGVPLDTLDTDGWHRVLPSLMEALRELADVRLPGSGFGFYGANGDAPCETWSDWLLGELLGEGRGRIAGWRSALAAVPGAVGRYEAGVERFAELVAVCPELRHAVHTDLGAGNTLTAGSRISGIIDWGNAVAGDPLYDVAHLTFWAPWHPGCPEALLRRYAGETFDTDDFEQRIRAYELHISLTDQRFNAVMGRTHMLEQVAIRGAYLSQRGS